MQSSKKNFKHVQRIHRIQKQHGQITEETKLRDENKFLIKVQENIKKKNR